MNKNMKIFFFFLIFLLNGCSFDDKTGIWKNNGSHGSLKEAKKPFGNFQKISTSEKIFNKTIIFEDIIDIKRQVPLENIEWREIFFSENNNLANFSYNDLNEIKFISKKISKNELENYFLVDKNRLLIGDTKGNLIIFSIDENTILNKFNFYKKRFKKIKKKLNYIVENNIIYITDNLGFVYAYNFVEQKILWAKNYKVPFRSNLKIVNNKLIASNQDNNLIFLNKRNGNILKLIPTEESIIKNEFVNSLSLDENRLFFLNSFGSLYAFDIEDMSILWFLNLNQTLDSTPSNLFSGSQIINNKGRVIVSSNQFTYIIDSNNGSILSKKNFSNNNIRPIIFNELVFFVTNNNLLICMNLKNNKILYSYNLNELISNHIKTTPKNAEFKNFLLLNNKIFIFLKNSYILRLELEGNLLEVKKLPSKIASQPIIVNKSILYLNKKNKVAIIN